jgi:hypothetical protein
MANGSSSLLAAIGVPIWIYWGFCLIAAVLVIVNRNQAYDLLSPLLSSFDKKRGYHFYLSLGWGATLLASASYILLTHKFESGSYSLPDLLTFSVLNGILEQFMFIFWFLLGCYAGKIMTPNRPKLIFVSGYIGYALFSGLIHALFWVAVLPSHQPSLLTPVALAGMSLVWMWLFWRYQALVAIIAMHIVIDFLMIGYLHFSWFERF